MSFQTLRPFEWVREVASFFVKLWFFLTLALAGTLFAQGGNPPGLALLREKDLAGDLYALADAHFRGRSAGTLDELNAAAWLAEKYRSIGLKPAGDNGTYFQYFNLVRNELSETSSIELNGTPLGLWKEVAVAQLAPVSINATIVYLGAAAEVDLSTAEVAGKVVAMEANGKEYEPTKSLPTWRYHRSNMLKYGLPLLRRGAAAIVFVAEEAGERSWADANENFKRGLYDIQGGANEKVTATAPILWLHASAKSMIQTNQASLKASLNIAHYNYPSVNVVGEIDGTNKEFASEYVLYSGHSDAHGVRNSIKGDNVYHGADDNASVDVAMLACARAFVQYPAERPLLFIIHGAEERGLLGSKYYVEHPTVPIKDIIAVLNGDMIGRNDTDHASRLGSTPPHLNSQELLSMALAANEEGPKFTLDNSWDAASHVEGWYFRSDHVSYARAGVPALMYTSLLHPDYHTPQDIAESINFPKLKKMTEWMYRTGWKVANTPQRPALEHNFHLER